MFEIVCVFSQTELKISWFKK